MLQQIAKICLPSVMVSLLAIGAMAQTDSICMLMLVDSPAFNSFANSRIKPQINDIQKKAGVDKPFVNEILYIVYSKNGNYMGVSLPLDNNYKALKWYRFTYNSKDGFKSTAQNWEDKAINFANVMGETAGYMTSSYKSGGTDELLIVRKNGQPVSGLIFKGCATDAIDKEKNVHSKDYLKLLEKIRKMIVP